MQERRKIMEKYKIKCVSLLTKVFPTIEPKDDLANIKLSAFQNEVLSFQVAYYGNIECMEFVTFQIESQLKKDIRIRQVKLMPSIYPCSIVNYDDNYLDTKPGLYPDLLRDIQEAQVQIVPGQWQAVWIDVELKPEITKGLYQIECMLKDKEANTLCDTSIAIQVYEGELPNQILKHTQWFHADCLADYYQVEPWSNEHWDIIEKSLKIYGKRGINTILTPTFTPPLDTEIGGERTTVQLVDVTVEDRNYKFEFSKLKKWFDLCEKYGILYFEIAHLFTQWGANHAPKVMATVNGSYQRIFGWETDATSLEYAEFLKAYLTTLTKQLDQWRMQGRVYFHLSDEPEEKDIKAYQNAKELVKGYVGDYQIMDALSRYQFYEEGLVDKPVPGTNHIEPFLEHKVPGLWTYYCCAQGSEVSNCFFAMPSARNRILGLQLYKYDLEGFLHWGFNFYNTRYSIEHINPYEVTDAGGAFQSGDAFLVYPGADGAPEESLRLMVLAEAMQDMRALKWLETLTSKEYVLELIEEGLDQPLTFKTYPKEECYLLKLREKVNAKISSCLNESLKNAEG